MEICEAAPKIRPVNHPEPAHAGKRHPEARLPGKALLDAMKGRESSVGRVVPADRRHKRRGYERNSADPGNDRKDMQHAGKNEIIHLNDPLPANHMRPGLSRQKLEAHQSANKYTKRYQIYFY